MTTPQADDFEAIALPHLNDLYRSARHTLGSEAAAEDVVQETYLQAWKSFHRFEPGTNIRAWLFKILFHVINHHWRKNSRLVTVAEDEEFIFDQLTYEPPVPQELRDEDVLAALARVPENYRAVILLALRSSEQIETITQQIARNFFLSSEQSYTRKFYEALLTFKIEESLTKDQILEVYINQIYLGERAYGFASAERVYFGKALKDVTPAEAAMLAGMLQEMGEKAIPLPEADIPDPPADPSRPPFGPRGQRAGPSRGLRAPRRPAPSRG